MILKMFSPYLGAFVIVCLLAAVTSSADSFLLASGLTFSKDIVKGFLNPQADDRELIFWNRFFVLIAGGMGFAFAIVILDVVKLWITGLVLSTSILLVPYQFAWFSRRMNTEGVLSGMAAGGVMSLVWLLLGSPFGLHPIWIGIAVNMCCSILVSLLTQKPPLGEVNRTYYWSPNFKGIKNIP
jgi:Na+/proline symporter